MFKVDAIGFWDDEPKTVMVTIDVVTLAQLVKMVGARSPATGLTNELDMFYHDACEKVFNRFWEDGVDECPVS